MGYYQSASSALLHYLIVDAQCVDRGVMGTYAALVPLRLGYQKLKEICFDMFEVFAQVHA